MHFSNDRFNAALHTMQGKGLNVIIVQQLTKEFIEAQLAVHCKNESQRPSPFGDRRRFPGCAEYCEASHTSD